MTFSIEKGVGLKGLGFAALLLAWAPAAIAQSSQPGEAIVPDAEFDASLPRIQDDLNAPLEPILPFDQPPAPTPDPVLAQPLPPLATFDVTTPTEPVTTEADDEKAATIRYRVAVEGLKEVDLVARFGSLSALDKGDGQAANGAVVAARAREDERLALSLLQSEGYYDAVVTSRVEPAPNEPDRVIATISAVPGPRYKLGNVTMAGPDTVPPGLAREALQLKSGDPIVAATVEGGEANIRLRLPQQGYPFVAIGPRDVLLDPATQIGDYTVPVAPGPRSSFGGVRSEGDLAFNDSHVEVLRRFKPGELYDSRKVDDLREAMVATGLFSSVAVEPAAAGPLPDGTERVDLRVVQDAGPPRTLAAQAGFATGQGFTLRGSWTHRNLFPPEGALIVSGVAGTLEQGAGVTFRRSNAGKRDRTVSLGLNGSHQDFEAYEAFSAQISGRIARESTPIWQKVWTWGYGFEVIATDERRKVPGRTFGDGTYFIGALPAQLGYDRSNSLLDPTRGFRLSARVSPELSQRANGGFEQYLRTQLDGSVYYPFGEDFVLAGRARVGSIVGTPRDEIAPSRRFYAGGGGSVRGFGYQELGPRQIVPNPRFDPERPNRRPETLAVPLGGRGLTEFAVEGRYRFGNYGVVAFLDAGQVTSSSTPSVSDLRYGVGVGGRLYTNFGPLRIDVATPLARRRGESPITLYVSIGQAF